MRFILLSSLIALSSQQAFCVSSILEGQDEPPHNTAVCASASLSAYGNDVDQDHALLDNKQFHLVKNHEDTDLSLRSEVWENKDGNEIIIAYRGTIPTIANLLSDVAITKYAAGNQPSDPWNYLVQHLHSHVNHWKEQKYIFEEETYDSLLPYIPSASTVDKIKKGVNGTLGAAGMLGLASLPLTPLGAVAVGGTALYGTSNFLWGHYADNKSSNMLRQTVQAAYGFSNTTLDGYDRPLKVTYTGHSLGGFIATAVSELSPQQDSSAVTYNAPGGVANFIKENKGSILGETKPWGTWAKDLFIVSKDSCEHSFRGHTVNLTRSHDIVGRVGGDDATRKSIHVEQYKGDAPMPVDKYVLDNHGIRFLSRNLNPDLYEAAK